MVWWNAVSNTATCFTPGSTAWASRMPERFGGLCSGARSAHSSTAFTTASSMTTEAA